MWWPPVTAMSIRSSWVLRYSNWFWNLLPCLRCMWACKVLQQAGSVHDLVQAHCWEELMRESYWAIAQLLVFINNLYPGHFKPLIFPVLYQLRKFYGLKRPGCRLFVNSSSCAIAIEASYTCTWKSWSEGCSLMPLLYQMRCASYPLPLLPPFPSHVRFIEKFIKNKGLECLLNFLINMPQDVRWVGQPCGACGSHVKKM